MNLTVLDLGVLRRAIVAIGAILLATTAPAQTQTFNIWPGVAPGSETWTHVEKSEANTPIGLIVQNVVTPTLTAYLPERSKATGSAVIIAPGGAFVAVAMGLEGVPVARWLQERGVAAFVLKYRLLERVDGAPLPQNMDEAGKYGIADGVQAVKLLRQQAAKWEISPDRIGTLGFSAGGMVMSGALLQEAAAARPNFSAFVYGAPLGAMPAIPKDLPPIFLAWAQDDPQALGAMVSFRDALRAAGHRPEVHAYARGGHGFGLKRQGTTSDHWIDQLGYWLEANGFLTKDGAR